MNFFTLINTENFCDHPALIRLADIYAGSCELEIEYFAGFLC